MSKILFGDSSGMKLRLQFTRIESYDAAGATPPAGEAVTDLALFMDETITSSTVSNLTLSRDDFTVWYFTGVDLINDVSQYKITVFTSNEGIYENALIGASAHLEVPYETRAERTGAKKDITGEIVAFKKLYDKPKKDDAFWYELTLETRVHRFKCGMDSRLFVDRTIKEVINELCIYHYLSELPQDKTTNSFDLVRNSFFHFALKDESILEYKYPFITQYEESDFEMLHRMLFREGLLFYSETVAYDSYLKTSAGVIETKFYFDALIITDARSEDVDITTTPPTVTSRKIDYAPIYVDSIKFEEYENIKNIDMDLHKVTPIAGIDIIRPKQTEDGYLGDSYVQETIDNDSDKKLHSKKLVGKKVVLQDNAFIDMSKDLLADVSGFQLRNRILVNIVNGINSENCPHLSYDSIDVKVKIAQSFAYKANLGTFAATGTDDNYMVTKIQSYGHNSGVIGSSLAGEVGQKIKIDKSNRYSCRVYGTLIASKINSQDVSIPYARKFKMPPKVPSTMYGVICSPRYDFDTKGMVDEDGNAIYKITSTATPPVTVFVVNTAGTGAGTTAVYHEVQYNTEEKAYQKLDPAVAHTPPGGWVADKNKATYGLISTLITVQDTGFVLSYYDYAMTVGTLDSSGTKKVLNDNNRYLVKFNFNRHSYVVPLDFIQESSVPMQFSQLNEHEKTHSFYRNKRAGSSFPLRVDTQVLIGFLHDNCDMPYIKGAVDDATPSAIFWLGNYNSFSSFVASTYPVSSVEYGKVGSTKGDPTIYSFASDEK